MSKILVTTKQQSKATGTAIGGMVDYDDAPEWMQRQHDSLHAPLSDEASARLAAEHDRYIAEAAEMRSRVAEGKLPF